MAQLYRFTDENGQVRLLAEIDPAPGGSFNGGTVTGATTFAPTVAADVPLTITPPAGAAALFTEVIHVGDGQGHTLIGADAGGDVYFAVTAGGASFSVDAGASSGLLAISDGGVTLKAPAGNELQLSDAGAAHSLVRVGASNTLGFFGAAPAAKPTVVGAKLPSDVALASLLTALAGLGLITDSTT